MNQRSMWAVEVSGTPLKLSDTPASVRSAPPTLGQHTPTILTEDLQFTPADVAELRARGII